MEKIKLRIKTSIIVSIVFVPLLFFTSDSLVLAESMWEFPATASWRITDFNEDWVGTWFNDSFQSLGKFTAENNSLINLTITKQREIHGFYANIEFGNFSGNVTDTEIASVLVLSLWPWLPGLITHVNWTEHSKNASDVANGDYGGNLVNDEPIVVFNGMTRKSVRFIYSQDPAWGNQNTTLVYDKETGVLLQGKTEFKVHTKYSLTLLLVETSIIQEIPTTSTSSIIGGFELALAVVSLSCLKLKTSKKRRK